MTADLDGWLAQMRVEPNRTHSYSRARHTFGHNYFIASVIEIRLRDIWVRLSSVLILSLDLLARIAESTSRQKNPALPRAFIYRQTLHHCPLSALKFNPDATFTRSFIYAAARHIACKEQEHGGEYNVAEVRLRR